LEDYQRLQNLGASYNKASSTTAKTTHGSLMRQVLLQLDYPTSRQFEAKDDGGAKGPSSKIVNFAETWRLFDLYIDRKQVLKFC